MFHAPSEIARMVLRQRVVPKGSFFPILPVGRSRAGRLGKLCGHTYIADPFRVGVLARLWTECWHAPRSAAKQYQPLAGTASLCGRHVRRFVQLAEIDDGREDHRH